MKTFNASLASILFCMITVSGSALSSHHGALSSHQKCQDIPINIQTEEEKNNAEIACISPNTNIYEIFHKAQKLANGNDMKCHFYIHNKENYEYIGTLNINKQLFEELLMKYDHWLLTKLNTIKNELKDVNDTIDNRYEAIDDTYSEVNSRTHDDKKTSHHTTHRHKTHHSQDNHHRNEFDDRKVKSKHYIELDPRYDDTHKYFEVFLPKNKHKNDPRKIYINVDKDNKEFLLFDNEKHREINYKPIKIGLRELSAIADVIFNKAEAGKTVFTVNDENIKEPERYEIKKVDYEKVDEENGAQDEDVDLELGASKTDVSDSKNDYTELKDTVVDDHHIENDNTTNDLDFNNSKTNTFDVLSNVENKNKQGIIDIKDTDLLLDNTEVCTNNDVVQNNDIKLHNYDKNDDFNNDTNAQVEYNEQIDKTTTINENNYISNEENYKISSEENSQQDNTEDIVFRRSQIDENSLQTKENYAPAQEFNQRFGTSYNQLVTSKPKVLNIQTHIPTPCTMTNILDNSRNVNSNLGVNFNAISLADSTPFKVIETPCSSSLEELKLPQDVLNNIDPQLLPESNLYALPNALCPSSINMPTQNVVNIDTVTSNPLNFDHNLPPCELGNVFDKKNLIPLNNNANLPKPGSVCNQNGILNSLPDINRVGNYNNLYQKPFLQSTPCSPKEFSKNPCLLPNSHSGLKNPYAPFVSRPVSPLNHPNTKPNFLPNAFSYPQYLNQKRPCLPFSCTGQNPNLIAANLPKDSPLKLPSINPCFANKLIESAKKYSHYNIHLSLDEDSTIDHSKYGYLTEVPLTKLPNKPSFKLTKDKNKLIKSSDQSLLQSSLSKPALSISSSFEDEHRDFLEKTSQAHSKLDSSLINQHLDLGSPQFLPDSTNFNNANVLSDRDIESLINILSQSGNSIHSLKETGLIAPESLGASLVGPSLDSNKSSGDFISSTLSSSTIPSSSPSSSYLESSLIGSSLDLDKSSTNLRPLDSSLIGQNLELNESQGTLMSTLPGSNESPSYLTGVDALSNEELHVSKTLDSSLLGPGLKLDKKSSIITPPSSNLDLNVLSGSYPNTNVISPTNLNDINDSVNSESIPSQFLDATLIDPGLKLNNLMTDTLTNKNELSTDLNEINALGDQGLNYLDTSLIGPELNVDRTSVLTAQDGITTPFSIKEETRPSTQNDVPSLTLDSSLIGPSLETLSPELKLDNRVQILDENDTTNPLIVHNDNDDLNTVEDSVPESVTDTLGHIKEIWPRREDVATIRNEDLPKIAQTNATASVVNTDNDVNVNTNETELPGDRVPFLESTTIINVDLSNNTETQIDNPINIINTTNKGLQLTDVPQTELDLNPTTEGGKSNNNVEMQEPTASTPNDMSDLEKDVINSGSHKVINIPNDVDNAESEITNTHLNIDEDALNSIISENNITLEPREHVKLIDVPNATDNDSKLNENPEDYVVLHTTNMKDGNLLTQIDKNVNPNDSLGNSVKEINIIGQEIEHNDMNISTIPAEIMTNASYVEDANSPAVHNQELLMNDIKPVNEAMNIEPYTEAKKVINPITNGDTNDSNNAKNILIQESRRSEPNDEVTVLDSSLIGPSIDLTKEFPLNLIGGKVDSLTGPSLFQELYKMENMPAITVNNLSDRSLTSASLFQDRIKEMNPTINCNIHLDSSLINGVPGLDLDTDTNLSKNIGGDSFSLGTNEGSTNIKVNDRFLDHTLIGSSLPVEKFVDPLAYFKDSSKLQHAILSILNSENIMDTSTTGTDLLSLSKNAEKSLAFKENPELDMTRLTSLDSFGNKNGYNFDQSIASMPIGYKSSALGIGLPFDWTASSMKPCISSTPMTPYSSLSNPTPIEYAPSISGIGLPFDWTASSKKPSVSSTPMSSYCSLSSQTPMEYAPSTLGIGLPFDWTASSMKPSISSIPMSSPYYSMPMEYASSTFSLGLPFDRSASSTPFLPYSSLSRSSYSNILLSSYPPSPLYTNEYQKPSAQASMPYKTTKLPNQNFPNTFIPKPTTPICYNPIFSDNPLPKTSESNPFLPLSRTPLSKPDSALNPFSMTPLTPSSMVKPCQTLTVTTKSLLKDNSFTNSKPFKSLPSDLIRPYLSESSSSTYPSRPCFTNNNNMLPLATTAITNLIPPISSSSSFIPNPCITTDNILSSSQNISPITNSIPSLEFQTILLNNLLNSPPEEKPLHFLPQSLSFLDQEHQSLQSIKLANSPMQAPAPYPEYLSKLFSDFQKPRFTSIQNSSPSINIELLKPLTTQFPSFTPSSYNTSFTQMDSPINKWTIPLPTTSLQNFVTPISLTPSSMAPEFEFIKKQPLYQISSNNIPNNIPFSEWNSLVSREYVPTLSKPNFSMPSLKQESGITASAKEPLLLNGIKSLFDKSRTDLSRDAYKINIVPPNTAKTLSTSNLNSMPLQTGFKMQSASPYSSMNQIIPSLSTNSMFFDEEVKLTPEYLDSLSPDNMPEDNEVIQNEIPNLQFKELNNNILVGKETADEIARLLERDKQSRSISNFDTNVITGLNGPMYGTSTSNFEPCEIDSRNENSMASPMPFIEPILGVNNFNFPNSMYYQAPADFKPYAADDKATIPIPTLVPCANNFNFPMSSFTPYEYEPYASNDKPPIPISSPVSFTRPNILTNSPSPYANSVMAPIFRAPSISLPCKPLTCTLPTPPSSSSTQPLPNEFRPFSPVTETKLASLPAMLGLPSEFSPSSPVLESKSPSLAPSNGVESTSIPLSKLPESYSSIPDNIETFSTESVILPNSQLIPLSLVKSQTEPLTSTNKNEDIVPKTDNFKWSDTDLDKFQPYGDETETNFLETEDYDEKDSRFYYSNDSFDKYHEGPFIVEPEELNYIENENDLQPSASLDKDVFSNAVSTKPLTPQITLDNLHIETKSPSIEYSTPITTLSAPLLESLSFAPLTYKSMFDDTVTPSINYATPITTLSAPTLESLSLSPPALSVNLFKISPVCEAPSSSSTTTSESPLLDYSPSLLNSGSYSPYISSINYNTPCLSSNFIKPCSTLPILSKPTSPYMTVPKSSFSSPNRASFSQNLTPSALHNKYEPQILTPSTVPFTNPILGALNSLYAMNDLRPLHVKSYNMLDKISISMSKSMPCDTPSIGVNTFNSLNSTPRKYEPYATDYRIPISMPCSWSSPNIASLPTGSFVSYLSKPPSQFSSSPISNVPISLTSFSPNALQYSSPTQPCQSLSVPSNPIPSLAALSHIKENPCAQYNSQPYVSVNKVQTSSFSSVPNNLQKIPFISSSQIKEYPVLPYAPYESKPCVEVNKVLNPSPNVTPCTMLSLPCGSSMLSSTKAFESPKLPCITTIPSLLASELGPTSTPTPFSPKLASSSLFSTPTTLPTLPASQLPSLPNPLPSIEASAFTPNYPSITLPTSPLISSVRPLDSKPSFTSFTQSPFSSQMSSKPEFNPSTVSSSPFMQSLGVPSNFNTPFSKTPSIMTPICQNMPSMSSRPLISSAPSPTPDLNVLTPNKYVPFEVEYKNENSVPSMKNPVINSGPSKYRYTAPSEPSTKLPLSNVLNPFINSAQTNPNSCTPTVQTAPLTSPTPSLHTSESPFITVTPIKNTPIRNNNQQDLQFLTKASRLISSNPPLYSSKQPYITEIPIENTSSKTYTTQNVPCVYNTENTPTVAPTKTKAQNIPFVSNIPCLKPCLKPLIPRTESSINSPCINPISSPSEPFNSGLSKNISPIEVPPSTFTPSTLSSYNLIKPLTTKPCQPPSIQTPINTSPISPIPVPICITTPKPYTSMFEPNIASNSQTDTPTQPLSSTIPLSNTNSLYLTSELLQSPTTNVCHASMKSPTVSQTQSLPCKPLFSNFISLSPDKTVCSQFISNLPCETVGTMPIFTCLKSPCTQVSVIPSPILSQSLSLVPFSAKSPIMPPPSSHQSLIPTLSSFQSPAGSINLPQLPCYQPLISFLSSPKSPSRSFSYPLSQSLNPLSNVPENTEYYLPSSKPTHIPPFFLTPQDHNLIQTPTLYSASNYQPCIQPTLPNKDTNPISSIEFYKPESRVKQKEDLFSLDDLNNLPNELKGYNYKPYIIEGIMPELEKDLHVEEREFDNNQFYTEKENLNKIIDDYANDDENLEEIHYTNKQTQDFDTNYLTNNNYIARHPMQTTYDTIQDENRTDALDLTNIPSEYHNSIPKSEINEQENNPESLKESQYYIDEIQPEITKTNPLTDDKSSNDSGTDLFSIQNRPNLIPKQFNLDNSDLKSPETDYFEDIPNDYKYAGYKSCQMPLTNLRNKPPLNFNHINAYRDFNYYNPTNMYSPIQDSITETTKQPEWNLNNQNQSPKLTNTNPLKDILIKYLKENDLSDLKDEITIPIGNIAFIDDDDKPITNIDMKNPDLNLKMWKSNVKIVNAEIKVKCKEVTVNNFMPIQKPNTFDDYRHIVQRYIEDKYGHCILMDKPYTKETRYSVLKDFEPSAVGYNFNLLWPTHYV